ncbi:MAG: hypothetical protein ACK5AY_11095 [Bacteroidota bacterium]
MIPPSIGIHGGGQHGGCKPPVGGGGGGNCDFKKKVTKIKRKVKDNLGFVNNFIFARI